MLLSERVREIGVDETRITDDQIGAARRALVNEMRGGSRVATPVRRRRVWAGVGIGGLVAGAAVTAIVVGSTVAPPIAPRASAAVFEEAAAGASASAETVLSAGQYLRLETSFAWQAPWDSDMPEGARFNNSDPADAEAVLVVADQRTTYIPSDNQEVWVREVSPLVITDARGVGLAEARAEWEADSVDSPLVGVTRYPAGVALAGGDGGDVEYYLDDRDLYADMPNDVDGVVDWFAQRYGGEGDANGLGHYFVETISDVSVFNLAPAAARAGMLRAFATLEGVELMSSDGDIARLRYERSNTDGERSVMEFSLDMSRGYVLDVTSWPFGVSPSESGDDASWATRTEASVSVVDTAP